MLSTLAPAIMLGAYLIGSFPSGYIVGRIKGVDLRKEGSGNIGATNALRVLGKKWGYLVFAADILKGWLSVKLGYALAYRFAPDHLVALGVVAALFSVLGHNFPVWLGFNGGKGIATSAGIMIALFPIWVFLCGLVVWVMIFFTTRYVSVASIFAAISLSFSTAILAYIGKLTNSPNGSKGDWLLVVVAVIMSALAVWRHKSNIERLFSGKEKKFERRKSSSGS